MHMVRVDTIKRIIEKLTFLKTQIELENVMHLFDNNIGLEDFTCGLMNLVYGYNLKNLNKNQMNYPGIDLADPILQIAVQVTVEKTKEKIQSTIDTLIKKEYMKHYKRLIIFLYADKDRYNGEFETQNKFEFNKNEDIITVKKLLKDIDGCSDHCLKKIDLYLEEQLISYPKKTQHIEPIDFLKEEKKKVYAMCLMKLNTLGVSLQIGNCIIENDLKNRKWNDILTEPVLYLVGDFGSGKSHFLYELTLYYIQEYIEGRSNRVPVFIEANEIDQYGKLENLLEQKNINAENNIIIIDGLDEIEYGKIEKLMRELDYISILYNHVNIIVGSRYMSILTGQKSINVPALSDTEINDLYEKITGNTNLRVEYYSNRRNGKTLKKMLEKPFFTILYAKYKMTCQGYVKNEIELVNIFIEQALKPYLEKYPKMLYHMEKLAAVAINRNYQGIHKSEIPVDINENELLKSGFIKMNSSKSYIFTLPIITQWLGARAIRDNVINMHEIINSESKLLLWRYPVSILFNQMTYDESEDYFKDIVEKYPAIASIIVKDGISMEGTFEVWDAKEKGEKIYECMQSWLKGMGNLAVTLNMLDNDKVNTLAILESNENTIEFSWADKYLGEKVLFICGNQKLNFHFKYRIHRGIPNQATWPWIVTFEYLSNLIKKMCKRKIWLIFDGIMEKEFIWKITLKLLGKGSLYSTDIEIANIEKYRTPSLYYKNLNLELYFLMIDRLKDRGETFIRVPFVKGDKAKKSGWIWSSYSQIQMKRRVQKMYEDALIEYKNIIEIFWSKFSGQFEMYLNFPCKLVGLLYYNDENIDDYESRPLMQYYLEVLPESERISVEIALASRRSAFEENVDDIFKKMKQNALKYRKNKIENMGYTIWSGECMSSSCTPVTDIIYKMLENDLKKVGWIE